VPDDKKISTSAGFGFTFRRPQLTKYVRALNSRRSLLYWKAANQRTDNKLDADDATDIDFEANHPTSITANELGLLSRWIDIGNPGGILELLDTTQKPTLHVAATADGVELRIGTVDIGSGIDRASLEVCVAPESQDFCANNLAGPAKKHGVTLVSLGNIDPETEILARVKDITGNETVVRQTMSWLTNTGSTPPHHPFPIILRRFRRKTFRCTVSRKQAGAVTAPALHDHSLHL